MVGEFDALLGFSETELEGKVDPQTWRDPDKFIKWCTDCKDINLDTLDKSIVKESYAAVMWQFRKAAIDGDYKAARSLDIWLKWAQAVIARREDTDEENINPSGSAAFAPRIPKEQFT